MKETHEKGEYAPHCDWGGNRLREVDITARCCSSTAWCAAPRNGLHAIKMLPQGREQHPTAKKRAVLLRTLRLKERVWRMSIVSPTSPNGSTRSPARPRRPVARIGTRVSPLTSRSPLRGRRLLSAQPEYQQGAVALHVARGALLETFRTGAWTVCSALSHTLQRNGDAPVRP